MSKSYFLARRELVRALNEPEPQRVERVRCVLANFGDILGYSMADAGWIVAERYGDRRRPRPA